MLGSRFSISKDYKAEIYINKLNLTHSDPNVAKSNAKFHQNCTNYISKTIAKIKNNYGDSKM